MDKPKWVDIKERMLAKRLADIQELEFQYKKARMREAWQNPNGVSRFAASKIILRDMETSLKIALEGQETITQYYPSQAQTYVEDVANLPGFEVTKMVLEKIKQKREKKTNSQFIRRLVVYDEKLKETQNTYEKLDAERQRMREQFAKDAENFKSHEEELNRIETPMPLAERIAAMNEEKENESEEEENGEEKLCEDNQRVTEEQKKE